MSYRIKLADQALAPSWYISYVPKNEYWHDSGEARFPWHSLRSESDDILNIADYWPKGKHNPIPSTSFIVWVHSVEMLSEQMMDSVMEHFSVHVTGDWSNRACLLTAPQVELMNNLVEWEHYQSQIKIINPSKNVVSLNNLISCCDCSKSACRKHVSTRLFVRNQFQQIIFIK